MGRLLTIGIFCIWAYVIPAFGSESDEFQHIRFNLMCGYAGQNWVIGHYDNPSRIYDFMKALRNRTEQDRLLKIVDDKLNNCRKNTPDRDTRTFHLCAPATQVPNTSEFSNGCQQAPNERVVFAAFYDSVREQPWANRRLPPHVFIAAVDAQNERQSAARKALEARLLTHEKFETEYKISKWTNRRELTANPFQFKDQVVASEARFIRMLTEDQAIFGADACMAVPCGDAIAVSKLPSTAFKGGENLILAVKVKGTRPLKGTPSETTIPDLEYVGHYVCKQRDCQDILPR